LNTIDATPCVSVGDMGTLFSQHYLFVKAALRTNTRKMECAETGRMQLRCDRKSQSHRGMAAKTLIAEPLSATCESHGYVS
jgi:hypothetical protein